MSEFTAPEIAPATGTTPTATPAEVTPSASVSDAVVSQPNADVSSVQESAPVDGSQPSPQEFEFPDEQSFQSLSGQEQKSNWQRLREQYQETKNQLAELQPLAEQKPIFEQMQEMGGWETLQQKAATLDQLFAPEIDPNTQAPVIDPETGLPRYTARPFVESLADQSPNTLAEVLWHGFDMPLNDDETLGHWFLRERLGLDPALLETYQQIQSPQDAAKYVAQASGFDPQEFDIIAPQYHEVYKTLSPELRAEVQAMSETAREQYLAREQSMLKLEKFQQEQAAFQEQQKAAAQAEFQQKVHAYGEQIIGERRNASLAAATQLLQDKANFFPDADSNQMVWNEAIQHSISRVEADPTMASKLTGCDSAYRLAAYYEMQRDTWKAAQARTEAEKLANQIDLKFRNYLTERIGAWSKLVGTARNGHQQMVNNANARPEIGVSGSQAAGQSTPLTQGVSPANQRFGITPDRVAQLAAQLQANRMGR